MMIDLDEIINELYKYNIDFDLRDPLKSYFKELVCNHPEISSENKKKRTISNIWNVSVSKYSRNESFKCNKCLIGKNKRMSKDKKKTCYDVFKRYLYGRYYLFSFIKKDRVCIKRPNNDKE
jgi:hypothetical protein